MFRRRAMQVIFGVVASVSMGVPAFAYVAPVQGHIVDHFRAPESPYGPGNRGLEYAVESGSLVRATDGGTVTFAGQVGGSLFVTILHDDGLRSTYGHMSSIAVSVGQRVEQSEVVGQSSERLHFGIREGDEYIDPELLVAGPGAHLVPTHIGS